MHLNRSRLPMSVVSELLVVVLGVAYVLVTPPLRVNPVPSVPAVWAQRQQLI
jgi:hypothetical protein